MKTIIENEKKLYLADSYSEMRKKRHKRYTIWKYLYYFRYFQYYNDKRKEEKNKYFRFLYKLLYRFYERKKNILSEIAGIEIGAHSKIGENLNIWHSNVVINGHIGKNCTFHGNNIVGNKGIHKENEFPILGNDIDVGAGAIIIGDVRIADGCVIGAGAVVTKSFIEPKSIIVGVPAYKK